MRAAFICRQGSDRHIVPGLTFNVPLSGSELPGAFLATTSFLRQRAGNALASDWIFEGTATCGSGKQLTSPLIDPQMQLIVFNDCFLNRVQSKMRIHE